MYKTRPAFLLQLGCNIPAVLLMRHDTPIDQRSSLLASSINGLETLITEAKAEEMLPRSVDLGRRLLEELRAWQRGERMVSQIPALHQDVRSFTIVLGEEFERTHVFTLTEKGNLSVEKLVQGASLGYPKEVQECLDDWMRDEIDSAGKCLACTLYTASGFHVLRSVEIGIKGYIHAATGSLPPLNRRNWGQYIDELEKAKASDKLVDLVRILKAKRNPLMHPQETLDEPEAIDLLCICQAVTGALVKDVQEHALVEKFKASLGVLPEL